jgi:hypothetical protein
MLSRLVWGFSSHHEEHEGHEEGAVRIPTIYDFLLQPGIESRTASQPDLVEVLSRVFFVLFVVRIQLSFAKSLVTQKRARTNPRAVASSDLNADTLSQEPALAQTEPGVMAEECGN